MKKAAKDVMSSVREKTCEKFKCRAKDDFFNNFEKLIYRINHEL